MKDPNVRLVLDGSAVAAYAHGSNNLGETITEVVGEDGRFAVPVVALAAAVAGLPAGDAQVVRLLTGHTHCVVLPTAVEDEGPLTEWTRELGLVEVAAVVVEAVDRPAAYVVTAEPHRYGSLVDGGLIIAI